MMLAQINTHHLIFSGCTHTDGLIYDKANDPCHDKREHRGQHAGFDLGQKLAGVPVKQAGAGRVDRFEGK